MQALPQAIPLALAAAVYPPAIIVCALLLTGDRPRLLLGAYVAGAALIVFGVGIAGLLLLDGTQATESADEGRSAGVDVALGVLLLALGAWLWRRRHRPPRAAPAGDDGPAASTGSRAARWPAPARRSSWGSSCTCPRRCTWRRSS